MRKTPLVPLSLSALLLASPLIMAVEAHHPEEGAMTAEESSAVEASGEGAAETLARPGGMTTGDQEAMGSGMMEAQEPEESSQPGAMGPGMMMGGPGMMSGPGMMRPGMGKGGCMEMMPQGGKGGRQEGMMGRRGMMGMMHGGMGGGMGMRHGGRHEKHRELIGRLDLLEARMAKIEVMLERLLER
jgi:hypothetical protein